MGDLRKSLKREIVIVLSGKNEKEKPKLAEQGLFVPSMVNLYSGRMPMPLTLLHMQNGRTVHSNLAMVRACYNTEMYHNELKPVQGDIAA